MCRELHRLGCAGGAGLAPPCSAEPNLVWHGTRVAVFVDGRFCQGCPERHALDWDLPESEQPAVQAEMRR